jgi:dolichol kinase
VPSRDVLAFAASSMGMVVFVESVKALAAHGVCSSVVARKFMHIGCGPLFVLTWPLFTQQGSSIASLVPLAMTLKFAATGLGLLKSRHALAEVRAMSRTGDPAELLRGPMLYGIAFCALTRFCWRSVPGVAAMMALCMGDGLAEVFGRIYGHARLPWSPKKSWAGSAAFLLSAVVSSAAFAELFRVWGWSTATTGELIGPLLLACAAGCVVESLPLRDVDNVLVPFVVAAILSRLRQP